MILTADIGNTNITLGGYNGEKLVFIARLYTQRHKTSDEFAANISDVFSLYKVDKNSFSGAVMSCVVPEISNAFEKAIKIVTGLTPLKVGGEFCGNLKVDVLPVEQLGADLICGCIGAREKYPMPCLVVDLGTASKILALDKDGKFVGCVICPGIKISLDALAGSASLLPQISFTKPDRVVGRNTVECMQSGAVYGCAAMIDGLVKRMKEELKFDNACVVATGGYSKGVIPCCESEIIHDENLVLDGLKAIYDLAKKKG